MLPNTVHSVQVYLLYNLFRADATIVNDAATLKITVGTYETAASFPTTIHNISDFQNEKLFTWHSNISKETIEKKRLLCFTVK